MTTKEIIQKYGIDHYYDEKKTHYIVFPQAISKEDAMRAANMVFKVNAKKLEVTRGFVIKDTLYFKKPLLERDFVPVWAVEVIK